MTFFCYSISRKKNWYKFYLPQPLHDDIFDFLSNLINVALFQPFDFIRLICKNNGYGEIKYKVLFEYRLYDKNFHQFHGITTTYTIDFQKNMLYGNPMDTYYGFFKNYNQINDIFNSKIYLLDHSKYSELKKDIWDLLATLKIPLANNKKVMFRLLKRIKEKHWNKKLNKYYDPQKTYIMISFLPPEMINLILNYHNSLTRISRAKACSAHSVRVAI